MIHSRGRLAKVALLALGLSAGGCRKEAVDRAAPPGATGDSPLATRLEAMPPAAQIDTMRALVAADTADAQLQFLSGNAYYSFASSLEASAPNRIAYLDSAIAAYDRAVAADTSMSKAYVNMGLAYHDHNQTLEARRALERAIEVNPNDVLAYCHLGFVSHMNGDVSEAIRQYNRALAIDPANAQAHYNLGLAFAEAKIFAEAVREWELVIQYDPDGDLGRTAGENVRIIQQYMEK